MGAAEPGTEYTGRSEVVCCAPLCLVAALLDISPGSARGEGMVFAPLTPLCLPPPEAGEVAPRSGVDGGCRARHQVLRSAARPTPLAFWM